MIELGDNMKKLLLIVGIVVFYLVVGEVTTKTNLIPKEAIRIRVKANSDTIKDQEMKLAIKEELENYYFQLLKDTKGVDKASLKIQNSLPEVEELISSVAGNKDFHIHYGMNYFPKKEYKGISYDEGYYKSLVVTLGEGVGKNWWCVLFPPLCLLENEGMEEVEYRSFVADLLEKYF